MKKSLLCYFVFILSLSGCQYLPSIHWENESDDRPEVSRNKPRPKVQVKTKLSKVQLLMSYGVKFDAEFKLKPKRTCAKYNQLYQKGDWRAGWVLAMAVDKVDSKHCFSYKDTIWILKHLESKKLVDPDLYWFNQYYSSLVRKLQQKTEQVIQLNDSVNERQRLIDGLLKENQALDEKLKALKAIETNY